MRFQALQGFNERQLPLLPRSPDVGDAAKHRDVSVASYDFPLHLTPCEALQAIESLLGRKPIMLVEPRDGGLPSQGSVPSAIVAVVDIRGELVAQGFKAPFVIPPIKVLHVIPECAFQLAVGLWVIDRGMDQANPHVLTKRDQQPSFEWCSVIEDDGFGNHSPLPWSVRESSIRPSRRNGRKIYGKAVRCPFAA